MTRYLLPILALALALLLAACDTNAPAETTYDRYVSELTNISLDVPADWEISENPDSLIIRSGEGEAETTISLSAVPGAVNTPATLRELVESGTRSLQNQEGTTIVAEPAQTTINDQPAVFTTIQLTGAAGDEVLQYGVIGGAGQVLFVTAVSATAVADSHQASVDTIINSINIPAPPASAP